MPAIGGAFGMVVGASCSAPAADELRLADRLAGGAGRPGALAARHSTKTVGDDSVCRMTGVGREVVEAVRQSPSVGPEVVVGVDDRAVRDR